MTHLEQLEEMGLPRGASVMQTITDNLRYIDITFECLTRAKRIVNRVDGWEGPKFSDELPSPRSEKIGRIMGRLRVKQCAREGIAYQPTISNEQPTASEAKVPAWRVAA